MENTRVYKPNSIQAAQHSVFGYIDTPATAVYGKNHYCCVMISDIHYSYTIQPNILNKGSYYEIYQAAQQKGETISGVIDNGYSVCVPIPIGSKYCALNDFDKNTLIKTGNDMENFYGFFIIQGNFKFIIPIYKKPFNKPIVIKNEHEDQLARTEVLYTTSYYYDNSFYVVGAILGQKLRSGASNGVHDYGFSLQLSHPKMNSEATINSKNKLINFIPIKFLFAAFGCITDKKMLSYICPDGQDLGLINAIYKACLQGYKHRELVSKLNIKVRNHPMYILYEEPITEFTAKYIIGMTILKEDSISALIAKVDNRMTDFKLLVVQTVTAILNERFMPGIGNLSDTNRNVAVCVELGAIIKKLYLVGNNLEPSQDKTSLVNRRIRHGQQLAYEFKSFHSARLREVSEQLENLFHDKKDFHSMKDIVRVKMEEMAKLMSLAQSKSLINAWKGTSQEISKITTDFVEAKNFIFVSNLKRQITPLVDKRKNGSQLTWDHRSVHPSDLFFVCPTQSTEDAGKFKTPAIYTYLTTEDSEQKIMSFIKNCSEFQENTTSQNEFYTIRINGSIVGYVKQYDDVDSIYEKLMEARSSGALIHDDTVVLNHHQMVLDIWCDIGRIVSPFIRVKGTFALTQKMKGGYIPLTESAVLKQIQGGTAMGSLSIQKNFVEWLQACAKDSHVLHKGIPLRFIEFLDPEMVINNAVIAPCIDDFYKKPQMYTHIAMPNHINGIVASVISMTASNHAMRAILTTNFVKQDIGPATRYPQLKYFKDNHVLIAPQIPLCRPCTYNFLHINEFPVGHNIIVAFMQYKYNQFDSIILNRSSVENGLLEIDSLMSVQDELQSKNDTYKVPATNIALNGNAQGYLKLDKNTAMPRDLGTLFYENDPIIGKVRTVANGEVDFSILNEKPDGKFPKSAYMRPIRLVVKNKLFDDNKNNKNITFGQFRVMITGDKLTSNHAQKATVGCILKDEQMPYSTNGFKPDVIFNPMPVFKRKTFGHLYEGIMSKICALLGCPIDMTQFHTFRTEEDVASLLKELGLEESECETMYDPDTGAPHKAKIFFTSHYWGRQSHLVEQKINIRMGGARKFDTGLPEKGRKHHGGQAVDRMSFDSHIAAGISNVMRETHLNQGAKIKIGICKRCHTTMGYYNYALQEWTCPRCGIHSDFIIREIVPAANLMTHIFNGAHIAIDYFE
jgi:DNA-directed RNA polymerase beta subunit